MNEIVLYTTPFCGYCRAAKRLLDKKGASYSEIDLYRFPDKRGEMVQRSRGGRTVPQIFIGGRHIGGFDELYALDLGGKLDPILAA
ncbi:MAG: glutaredoxin 3 [Paracoccaceae bacterium]